MKNKIAKLWKDERSIKERLLISVSIIFCMLFTFLLFGPFEIVASSKGSVSIYPIEVITIMGTIIVFGTIVLTLMVIFIKGKIFNVIMLLLSFVTIAGYVQGNFLNGAIGPLTGELMGWDGMTSNMITGFLVWLIIFAILSFFLYIDEHKCLKALQIISIVLCVMQGVALITLSVGSIQGNNFFVRKAMYASSEDMFMYSKENNTIVFLLDQLDYDYIEQIKEEEPDFFDPLTGFVEYTNAIGTFSQTQPGAVTLLGKANDAYEIDKSEFYDTIFDNDENNVFKGLSDAGYTNDVYAVMPFLMNNSVGQLDRIDNVKNDKDQVNTKIAIENLMNLSAYRYLPIAFKPFFWTDTGFINEGMRMRNDEIGDDETLFDQGIQDIKLDEENRFKFYHFGGSHGPHNLLEDGTKSQEPTDVITQTKGCFQILYRALDKMRELGIYEDATIIIAADHGNIVSGYNPLTKATRVGIFQKESGKNTEPLSFSNTPVTLENIPATILKSVGAPYDSLGIPLEDVKEDDNSVRVYTRQVRYSPEQTKVALSKEDKQELIYTYEVVGDASKFENWKLISKKKAPPNCWF